MRETTQLERILEGALFAAGYPLSMDQMLDLFEERAKPEKKAVKEALESLAKDYENRGIELKELASGFQFQVKSDLSFWIKHLWEERPAYYSRALLETLAIIAYRQPITRAEIEEIRGVTVSSPMVKTLLDREWVRVVGHKDVPGRPALLATTKAFLDYFGMKSLSELPTLSEIQALTLTEIELEKEHAREKANPERTES